ncbi:MAG: PHP domain-containing protein, partial [Candidatus Competibacteraceae bacterium]|nr:PHP domain-containing protein [Candidatus Competibacteraceae bacterium]
MSARFIHLHLHTEFSLVDGVVRIKPLIKHVVQAGMPAVAVTDMANMYGVVKFYKAALAAGIKPIIGADIWLQRNDEPASRMVLLCQDMTGFRNLSRLISRSYQEERQRDVVIVRRAWLDGCSDGLIALSGGREGEIGRLLLHDNPAQAQTCLDDWLQLFPDRYYLELQRTGRPDEETYLQAAVKLAGTAGVPVVASNDVRFLQADDFEAHEARVCINQSCVLTDPNRPRSYSEQQYLRTPEEMAELFADLPQALENSVE